MQTNNHEPYSQYISPPPAHKRQVFWQIWFPLGITVILILLVCFLAATATMQNANSGTQYAGVALIWILLPWMGTAVVVLVLLGISIYGLDKLIRILPRFMRRIFGFIELIHFQVRRFSDLSVKPIFGVREKWARWQALKRAIKPRQ
jgi:FtsH-binding integral membrane protein